MVRRKDNLKSQNQLQQYVLPNYNQNNVVNLMSSLCHALNISSPHPILPSLPPEKIKQYKNIIFCIIDGLGYDNLLKQPKENILKRHTLTSLTTIFPSTTAAAITTYLSGLTPQEHGNLSWFMYLQEKKDIIAILPGKNRQHKKIHYSPKALQFPQSIFTKLHNINSPRQTYIITKKDIINTTYNKYFGKHAETKGYKTLSSFINKISETVKRNQQPKYIYAYWSEFDALSHKYGKTHPKTQQHLQQLTSQFQLLHKKLQHTNTLLIITADHGQIVSSESQTIHLEKHPLLQQCLSTYLSGEHRAAFCHVLPHKRQQFEQYVKHKLQKYCTLHKPTDLLNQNLFGSITPHTPIHLETINRLGNYILLFKKNYIIRQTIPEDEKKKPQYGHHGGLSTEEMLVPLIKMEFAKK